MGRGIGKGALLAAFALLTFEVHAQMPIRARAARGDAFVPRPEVARASSLGFDAVVGDYYWLQAVQIVGDEGAPHEKGGLLGALVDVVTTLDPWVEHPYRFAAVWLTDSEASVRKANELLRRGIDHHPDDWRNRLYLGFNLFYYLDERVPAAEALEGAMELPGAPLYLRRLAARLKGAEGLDVAETFLHGLLLETDDEQIRSQYESALDEIATERVARVLDAARERYRERHGRDIEAVADLVRGPDPVLPALPPEPHGGAWTLDPWSKELVSDVVGHRYEPKIDPVSRKMLEGFRGRKAQGTSPARRGEEG